MRRIVITGASSGIGKALAERLLLVGDQVIGLCRSIENLPKGVHGISCDLKDAEAVRAAFTKIHSEFGEIDALVNNAGVALLSRISDGALEDWETMWNVNVRGLALCCQLALPLLSPQTGQIVNVSSMSGHRVPPTGGFYAPTKFAVRAITDALRAELRLDGKPLRVSSVSPGFVDTPLLNDYFKDREAVLEKTKREVKMLSAKDVAESIVRILDTPTHVEVGDVQLLPVDQKA